MNTDAILSNNKVTSLYASVVLHFSSLLKHFDIKALKTTIRAGDSRNDGAFELNTFLCNIKNSRPSEVIPELLFSLEVYPVVAWSQQNHCKAKHDYIFLMLLLMVKAFKMLMVMIQT